MRRSLIWFLLCAGFLLGGSVAHAQSDPASEVIRLVNQLRASRGLPAYQVDAILMSVAQAQASWSAANNHIGHDGPGGSSPNDRAQAAGYADGARSFAIENAAHGTASLNTPDLVVTMWQSDWGHLSAMISPDYEHIGVGYAVAGDNSWYVMMVGWVDDGSTAGGAQGHATPGESVPYIPFVLSEPDENGAIYHEVQPGQTAWTIAAQYGVDLAQLLALNNLTVDSILHPGDMIMVRPPESPTSTPSTAPTRVITETPGAGTPIPSLSPTPTNPTVDEAPPLSWVVPISVAVGSGIILLVVIELVRIWRARD
jgi:LysM repeat protein